MNTKSILRLCTESVVLSSVGCTFRGRPTKDSSRSQDFGFQRFRETRNETGGRHLLGHKVIGTSELSWNLLLLSNDRSTGVGLPAFWASTHSRRRSKRLPLLRALRAPSDTAVRSPDDLPSAPGNRSKPQGIVSGVSGLDPEKNLTVKLLFGDG